MDRRQRILLASACCLGAVIPVWIFVCVPQLEALPADFQYQADIISYDDFYDEQKGEYKGEQRSISDFVYKAIGTKEETLLIENTFTVHKVTGENIFAVKRVYGIDPLTRGHIAGAGDRERDGFLFAPRNLRKGEPLTYWHINYDGPARMTFSGEETLYGLPVYRYETRYEGVPIEQTKNLTGLPDVGVKLGIEADPYLQVWIEPVTGMMVKYADDTVAYYTDLRTGKRLHPWNHFRNTFTSESTAQHVEAAKQKKLVMLLHCFGVPGILGFMVILSLFFLVCKNRAARTLFAGGGSITVVLGLWCLLGPSARTDAVYAGPMETIRISVESGLLPAAVWVAEHNGYLRDQGIALDAKIFPSGRAALQALLQGGEFDMATVAQTPIVTNSFTRSDFVILGAMVSSLNDVKILARKDRDIHVPSDLRDKKIGITTGSTGHYFLGLFLAQHSLTIRDVEPVDMEASALADALADGMVDAIATWEPNIYRARTLLGDKALMLESRGTFREDFYFAAFKEWAKDNRDLLRRFFVAIDQAERFIAEHPAESQAVVASQLQLASAFIAAAWPDFSYRLFMDQAVILNFEQQSRWMIANSLISGNAPENYLDFIDVNALEAVKPSAVTIIR